MNIYAQIFGLIALILLFISYQQKNKQKFLYIQIFANIFYAIQYFLLFALSAMISSIISIIRTVIFHNNEKKGKTNSIFLLLFFELIFIIFGVFTYNKIYSIIPIFCACLYTFGIWQKNLKIIYVIGIVISFLWGYYSLVVGAYISIISSCVELFASTLGLVKIIKYKKQQK